MKVMAMLLVIVSSVPFDGLDGGLDLLYSCVCVLYTEKEKRSYVSVYG